MDKQKVYEIVRDCVSVDFCSQEQIDKYAAQCTDEILASQWISVDTELPEEDGWYLGGITFGKGSQRLIVRFDKHGFSPRYVTHWQPLPEAPGKP